MWLREAAPETRLVAESIQSMLREHLGVRITFRSADYPVFTSNMFNWNIRIGLAPFFADYRDPKNMLDMIWRPGERGRSRHDWNNSRFLALLNQADNEPDQRKRLTIYRQAEGLIVEEAGGVFIYHPVANNLYKLWLKGLRKNKFGGRTFEMTDLYIGREHPSVKN
jgi:ABC-type oligopeptide transport system substrate-binding subunit